jgi:RNA polymerase sigma factor (sigma-70 family)
MSMRVATRKPGEQFQRAAPEAFEDFFAMEWTRLFQTMFLACGDAAQAEDLAQESMARMFERWERVRRLEHPAAYLYRVAFNLHRRTMRRAQRAPATGTTPGRVEDPADVAGIRQQVLEVLRSLPGTQREAILLVEWLGMTAEEAARVLDIEPSSVRGRLHRARLAVAKRFGGLDA